MWKRLLKTGMRLTWRILPLLLLVPALPLSLSGCAEKPRRVSLHPHPPDTVISPPQNDKLKIAVGAIISPAQALIYYDDIFNYIGERLGLGVEMIQRKTYAEVNYLIREGRIDLAFVCSRPYIEGHRDFGMELLCVPVCFGKKEYCSYFIVHKDSPIATLEQLRGKSFAFSDPQSNSGALIPEYILAQMGETPKSFFRSFIFTYSHDNSIRSVVERYVDGAAVDNLIWEYLNVKDPELTVQTRIIYRSRPSAMPPVVVSPGIDRKRRRELQETFLTMHANPRGKEILNRLLIDRFETIADSSYNSIRRMEESLEEFHGKD